MNHTIQNQKDAGFGKVLMVGPVSSYLDSLTEALHASACVCALADPADIVVEVERQPVGMKARDGKWKRIGMTGKITNRDEQGHPTQVVGTMLDIVGENPSTSLIDQMQQSESCPDVPTER